MENEMETEHIRERRTAIAEFADEHGLVMQIHERSNAASMAGLKKFWAAFEYTEIANGPFLDSRHGDGDTEEEAIANYAIAISGELLVMNAYGNGRREIRVPMLRR